MAGRCAYLNCKNSRRKGFRTFRFPRDKERRAKWEALCQRKDFKATDNSEICEVHFTEDQFENNRQDGRRPLKWYALPDKWVKEQQANQNSVPEKDENTHFMQINLEKLISPTSSPSHVVITHEVLPKQYRNAIVSSTVAETVIRSDISSTSDIDDWVRTFGRNTGTRWNVRKSKPEVSCTRILCGKDYVCQHSAYHKAVTNNQNMNKKGISKSTKCEAKIVTRIKRSTTYMKQKDVHMKEGLLGFITIKNEHNHAFPSMISLKQLMMADNVREIFFDHFNKHISPTKDCKLQLTAEGFESGMDPNNIQINILRQTIMHWFNIWKGEKQESMKLMSEEDAPSYEENLPNSIFEPSVVSLAQKEFCGIENIILDDERDIVMQEDDYDFKKKDDDDDSKKEDDDEFIKQIDVDVIKEEDDEFDNIACCLVSEEETDEYESAANQTDVLNDVMDKLKQLHQEYGSSSNAIRSLKESLDKIKSCEEWETFLHTVSQ